MCRPANANSTKVLAPQAVTSIKQLLAAAFCSAREAACRYRELAISMRSQREAAVAGLFDRLASGEDSRATDVEARSIALTGYRPALNADVASLPTFFDDSAAGSFSLTSYRALSGVVRRGERAFTFYSYVAAYAGTPELRSLAEQFAKNELAHACLLRRERRRAWRAQLAFQTRVAPQPETLEMLLLEAVSIERAAAVAHRRLAERLRAGQALETATLFDAAAVGEEDVARLLTARLPATAAPEVRTLQARSVREGLHLLESAFERYSRIVERATTEDVLLQAQALSKHALRLLMSVRSAPDVTPASFEASSISAR